MDHAQFWQIIEGARTQAADVPAAASALDIALRALETPELIGFHRWLSACNEALMRVDVRFACRVLLGKEDSETVVGFRGWLIAQGEATVNAALHDLDAILDHAKHPVTACTAVIFVTTAPLRAHGISTRVDEDDREKLPRGSADWAVSAPTAAQLRERFPRLTAALADDQLVGPTDVSRLSLYERQRAASGLLERAKPLPDDANKLEQLERAHRLWPTNDEIRAARGRVHARLGHLDEALADFDAVIVTTIGVDNVLWERSKVRLARGDRDGALEDARASAHRVDEARAWLATFASASPKRVRHVKFGEGAVISQDATGAEPKLVIDFASGRKTIASRFVETIE